MVRGLRIILVLSLIWGMVAAAAVAVTAKTGVLWQAEAAYVLLAVLVLLAWMGSEFVLARLGPDRMHRPR